MTESRPVSIGASLPVFTAIGSSIRMGGTAIKLKGVSWFGAEGIGHVPDGLWANTLDFYLEFLMENDFNALRLPLALDTVMANPTPTKKMLQAESGLWELNYLDILERVVDAAAKRGILVLLDLHRLEAARWPHDGLWYKPGVTLKTLKDAWDRLQARFCQRWNVLGADIFNEPHGAKWKDWTVAAAELGNAVLSKCARWAARRASSVSAMGDASAIRWTPRSPSRASHDGSELDARCALRRHARSSRLRPAPRVVKLPTAS